MAPERGQMFVPSLMKVIICIPIVRDDHVLSPEKRASGDQQFCKKKTLTKGVGPCWPTVYSFYLLIKVHFIYLQTVTDVSL